MADIIRRLLPGVRALNPTLGDALERELTRRGRIPHGSCDCEACKGWSHEARHKRIALVYPRQYRDRVGVRYIPSVKVELLSSRAADDLRVTYDFDRDGWVCWQARFTSWDHMDDTDCDPGWVEVAFIPAWQVHEPRPWES